MAHEDSRSWVNLAVDVLTGHVEHGAKLVYTRVFLMEEVVVDV